MMLHRTLHTASRCRQAGRARRRHATQTARGFYVAAEQDITHQSLVAGAEEAGAAQDKASNQATEDAKHNLPVQT